MKPRTKINKIKDLLQLDVKFIDRLYLKSEASDIILIQKLQTIFKEWEAKK